MSAFIRNTAGGTAMTWLVATLLLMSSVAASAQALGPHELVQQTTERMLATLKEERATLEQHPERIYELVQEIVLPHFDFVRMSQWVLGRYWRSATPEQRERFVAEFRTLLVRTYATALIEYTDERISFPPLRAQPDATELVVRSEVHQPGGAIALDYRMHRTDEGWKVYDISVDGISLVTNYRSTFAADIRAGGLDRVIANLAAHNERVGR